MSHPTKPIRVPSRRSWIIFQMALSILVVAALLKLIHSLNSTKAETAEANEDLPPIHCEFMP
ncbi:MAG: hypothetical protein GY799_12510 [Desulfobulbaceae bacterium]|nr:hypothetical protein [Desulfobulbaceae bacterium]